jgi:hypothetical protein
VVLDFAFQDSSIFDVFKDILLLLLFQPKENDYTILEEYYLCDVILRLRSRRFVIGSLQGMVRGSPLRIYPRISLRSWVNFKARIGSVWYDFRSGGIWLRQYTGLMFVFTFMFVLHLSICFRMLG